LKDKLSRHFIGIGVFLWGWCMFMTGQVLAVESAYAAEMEYEVKAAFIHNFTKFIDWPSEAFETSDSPFRIGILGTGSIDKSLMNLSGKETQARLLEVSRVQNPNEYSQFHVIFVNSSENGRLKSILQTLKGAGILTVGDMPGFAERCGVINFYLKSGKVRFEINVEASHLEKLKISSKLLRLARIVNSECN
jgi:YfiR/HmsC-like